jgi:hypothetical protein
MKGKLVQNNTIGNHAFASIDGFADINVNVINILSDVIITTASSIVHFESDYVTLSNTGFSFVISGTSDQNYIRITRANIVLFTGSTVAFSHQGGNLDLHVDTLIVSSAGFASGTCVSVTSSGTFNGYFGSISTTIPDGAAVIITGTGTTQAYLTVDSVSTTTGNNITVTGGAQTFFNIGNAVSSGGQVLTFNGGTSNVSIKTITASNNYAIDITGTAVVDLQFGTINVANTTGTEAIVVSSAGTVYISGQMLTGSTNVDGITFNGSGNTTFDIDTININLTVANFASVNQPSIGIMNFIFNTITSNYNGFNIIAGNAIINGTTLTTNNIACNVGNNNITNFQGNFTLVNAISNCLNSTSQGTVFFYAIKATSGAAVINIDLTAAAASYTYGGYLVTTSTTSPVVNYTGASAPANNELLPSRLRTAFGTTAPFSIASGTLVVLIYAAPTSADLNVGTNVTIQPAAAFVF